MHDQQSIISTNRESNSNIDSDIYITRSMVAALSRIGRHRIRVLNNRAASDDSDDTVMYYPPHGVYLTDENMSNSQDSESDSEEEDEEDEE